MRKPCPPPGKHYGAPDSGPCCADRELVWRFLRQEHDLRSISPQEAKKLAEKGDFVIVDVRPANLHEQARVNNSANAPLFQQVDWSKPSFTKVSRSAL